MKCYVPKQDGELELLFKFEQGFSLFYYFYLFVVYLNICSVLINFSVLYQNGFFTMTRLRCLSMSHVSLQRIVIKKEVFLLTCSFETRRDRKYAHLLLS